MSKNLIDRDILLNPKQLKTLKKCVLETPDKEEISIPDVHYFKSLNVFSIFEVMKRVSIKKIHGNCLITGYFLSNCPDCLDTVQQNLCSIIGLEGTQKIKLERVSFDKNFYINSNTYKKFRATGLLFL
ncbi:MAG: hypothetical protein HYV28_04430 [Ignavibacteriales bacterium]|nr:hypothetical protein [Ignavibacteriales bacterium]